MRLSDSITISAPIEQAFDGWAALERSPEHQKPSIERTRLTDGPPRAGTRYRAVDQWPGRKVSFEAQFRPIEVAVGNIPVLRVASAGIGPWVSSLLAAFVILGIYNHMVVR